MHDDHYAHYMDEMLSITAKMMREPIVTKSRTLVNMLVGCKHGRQFAPAPVSTGRAFILGIGGSAANAQHFAADLRKVCRIDAICPTDNIAFTTAMTNDISWESVFIEYLSTSRLQSNDVVVAMSVGGASLNEEGEIAASVGLYNALVYARGVKNANCFAILGKLGKMAEVLHPSNVMLIPTPVGCENVYGHVETFQSAIWHAVVSHPLLKAR